jgi:hypothetical protein
MSATDRLCRIGSVISRLGPLTLPPRSAIVDALYRIASIGPDIRIGLVPAPDGRSWRYDPVGLRARCEQMVVEVPDDSDVDHAIAGVIATVDPMNPVRIVIAGQYLLHVYDHSLVDGRFTLGLPGAVLTVAAGGEVPEWLAAPTLRRPVVAAVVDTFVRHPRNLLAFLGARRRTRAAQSLGLEEDPVFEAEAPRVPWTPDTTVVWEAGVPAGFRDTRAWIRATDPRLSFGAVLLVMLRAALRAEGIVVGPDADMVYDVRRFLPEGGQTNGNLITGIPIAGAEDVEAVEDELTRTLEVGRPVAALAAGVFKESIRPRGVGPSIPADAPLYPRARISLSNIGISRPLQNLPWADAPVHSVTYAMHPVGPEMLSVQAVVIDRALQLTVSFNGNVFRREAVERAVHRVLHEPADVLASLDASRTGPAAGTTGPAAETPGPAAGTTGPAAETPDGVGGDGGGAV